MQARGLVSYIVAEREVEEVLLGQAFRPSLSSSSRWSQGTWYEEQTPFMESHNHEHKDCCSASISSIYLLRRSQLVHS